MKPTKNKTPILKKKRIVAYVCKHCGAEECGEMQYSELAYGTASLISLAGDCDNYDTSDGELDTTGYRCSNCEREGGSIDELFGEYEEEEEELEDEEE